MEEMDDKIELIVVDYVNQIPDESDTIFKKVVNFDGFSADHQVKALEKLQEEKSLYPDKEFVIYTVSDHYSMIVTEVLNNTYLIDLRTKQLDKATIMDEVITFVDGVKSGDINLGTDVNDIRISNLPQFINMLVEYCQTTGEFKWVINKVMTWNQAYLKFANKDSIITSLLLNMCDYTLKYNRYSPVNTSNKGWKF